MNVKKNKISKVENQRGTRKKKGDPCGPQMRESQGRD